MPDNSPSPSTGRRVGDRAAVVRRSARWNIAHADDQTVVPGSQSLQRALVLLNLVAVMGSERPGGVTLAELARSSGRPKASVHRILAALVQSGYVERVEPAGTYRLGHQALVLGALAGGTPDPLRQHAQDSVVRLAELSEDTSFLTVRQGGFSICVQREEGRGPIRNNALGVGDRHPLGIGAGAMAMLAALDDDEVAQVLQSNASILDQHYPRVDGPVLRTLVERTRREGYALNEGLHAPGSWAIGVAVRDPQGRPVAALSIATIEQRLGRERREALASTMRAEASVIEQALLEHALATGASAAPSTTTPSAPRRPNPHSRRPS